MHIKGMESKKYMPEILEIFLRTIGFLQNCFLFYLKNQKWNSPSWGVSSSKGGKGTGGSLLLWVVPPWTLLFKKNIEHKITQSNSFALIILTQIVHRFLVTIDCCQRQNWNNPQKTNKAAKREVFVFQQNTTQDNTLQCWTTRSIRRERTARRDTWHWKRRRRIFGIRKKGRKRDSRLACFPLFQFSPNSSPGEIVTLI